MTAGNQKALVRIVDNPDTPVPEVQLLSNGRYHVMVTSAGGGYSRWKNVAITRWLDDVAASGHIPGRVHNGACRVSPPRPRY